MPQPVNTVSIEPLPFNAEWRLWAARAATHLFSHSRDPAIDKMLGKPERAIGSAPPPMTVLDLLNFLKLADFKQPPGLYLIRLISDMVRIGLLMENPTVSPPPSLIFARSYWTINTTGVTTRGGDLWLSELIGPELVIPSYGSISLPIVGTTADGDEAIGTGILLSPTHILTNAHVVTDMTVGSAIKFPAITPPKVTRDTTPSLSAQVRGQPNVHSSFDVAVIELEENEWTEGRLLEGMKFREPLWGDETLIFGYPPVPTVRDDAPLVVQRGEVVNPKVTSYEGYSYFLYSAITRPGNSGGPIVAQDGRVLGLVAHEVSDVSRPAEAPFFRGIPTSTLRTALAEFELEHLIPLDEPVSTPNGVEDDFTATRDL